MRTTLNIDTVILEDLKRLREKEGVSLGQLVSRLLAEAIARRAAHPSGPAPSLGWQSQAMRARVDLDDKEAIFAALEGADH